MKAHDGFQGGLLFGPWRSESGPTSSGAAPLLWHGFPNEQDGPNQTNPSVSLPDQADVAKNNLMMIISNKSGNYWKSDPTHVRLPQTVPS